MDLKMTDPAHRERFVHFAPDEVVNEPGQQPDAEQRHTAILATLIGCGGIDTFREMLLGTAIFSPASSPDACPISVPPQSERPHLHQQSGGG